MVPNRKGRGKRSTESVKNGPFICLPVYRYTIRYVQTGGPTDSRYVKLNLKKYVNGLSICQN